MAKSPEEYREDARRIRALARQATAPEIQVALLGVATNYDELARAAETLTALETPEFSS
jgi:hypothetical protein